VRLLPIDRQKLAVGLVLTAGGLVSGWFGVWGSAPTLILGLFLTWTAL